VNGTAAGLSGMVRVGARGLRWLFPRFGVSRISPRGIDLASFWHRL